MSNSYFSNVRLRRNARAGGEATSNRCFNPSRIYKNLKEKYEIKLLNGHYILDSSKELFEKILFDIAKSKVLGFNKDWKSYFESISNIHENAWDKFIESGYSSFIVFLMNFWGLLEPFKQQGQEIDFEKEFFSLNCNGITKELNIFFEFLILKKKILEKIDDKNKNMFLNTLKFCCVLEKWQKFRMEDEMPDRLLITEMIEKVKNSYEYNSFAKDKYPVEMFKLEISNDFGSLKVIPP